MLRMAVPTVVVVAAFQGGSSPSGSTPLGQTDVLWRVLSVLLLIALNAFFVAAEFSIVSVRRSRIQQLVKAGDVRAKTVQDLQRTIDRLLSTTQLGITLSSLALGWIGERTVSVLVARSLMEFPLSENTSYVLAHSLSIPIGFFLVAYLQIVLGELCPKSVAMLYAEKLAKVLGPPSLAIARFFNPFIWILNQSTRLLLRLLGIRYTGGGWHNRVTPEELQLIIATERESTGLEAEERELLSNVFKFSDVSASEVMVPRTNIISLPCQATVQQLLQEVAVSGHSRYPAIGDSLDDVRGIIDFKELAAPLAEGTLDLSSPIESWMKPARFVPEYTYLSELLPLMQRLRTTYPSHNERRRTHQEMAIVVDEFGGTAGLLTIDDLVAQIIGGSDVDSNESSNVRILDEQTFLVQAQTNLEDVNEILNLDFPLTDEYQTLGGFTIYQLQKIPVVGDTLRYKNLQLRVISAEGPRLQEIEIQRLEPSPSDDVDDGSDLLAQTDESEAPEESTLDVDTSPLGGDASSSDNNSNSEKNEQGDRI
jgi:CBS domain containing-hemolysin-like protein